MKTIKTNEDSALYILPSIILNNKKAISPFFVLILIPIFLYSKYNQSLLHYSFFLLLLLVILFLISPLRLRLNRSEMQYHIFWKIKWSDFKSYSIDNRILTIKTVNGKEKVVKNLDTTISKKIEDIINTHIDATASSATAL